MVDYCVADGGNFNDLLWVIVWRVEVMFYGLLFGK